MSLTEQQKSQWKGQGYLSIEGLLSAGEVESLRRSVSNLEARAAGLTESNDRFILKAFNGADTKVVQQVAEPHELGGEWMALARDPRILDVVEGLLGANLQLYYSMFMMKPPAVGFTAPWHQDLAFFAHNRADVLACQVYVDDSTIENGCIRVVPGSHKQGLLNHYDEDGCFTGIVQGDTSTFDAKEVALPIRAGGMVIWHALTLHRSHPNRSQRPRRAIVFEYKNPEARLMGGAFNSRLEVRTVGLMVRGRDPQGDLLSAV
jgi:phytanoyl-CoA hydroxylase